MACKTQRWEDCLGQPAIYSSAIYGADGCKSFSYSLQESRVDAVTDAAVKLDGQWWDRELLRLYGPAPASVGNLPGGPADPPAQGFRFPPGRYITRNGHVAEIFCEREGYYWGRLQWLIDDNRTWKPQFWSSQPGLQGQAAMLEMQGAWDLMVYNPVPPIGLTHLALNAGEHYAGVLLGKDGECDQHLILLPGEAESVTWQGAKEWAAQVGGELPTRREQSLLFANAKEQFNTAWYWSSTQHVPSSDYAWFQDFNDGFQDNDPKSLQFRARAVRRVAI